MKELCPRENLVMRPSDAFICSLSDDLLAHFDSPIRRQLKYTNPKVATAVDRHTLMSRETLSERNCDKSWET